ncbi:hypothetical protein BKA64DRAFT_648399 [Cadophora sp. MPI-SDFR-AT-0126]|nr:hypothetical protein BKA61DRAFT_620503 [Leptodontidium sp. MPI-SDFR-AT-0119]KAH7378973.1 hypothetical protein BKA64DRAFT_648399 [Leotiomycetes sp. MPI-SDFR-AT-0126]
MAQTTETNKVLIIGAGPGGLVLAQSLRHRNIPYEVFERDAERSTRSQGWAVALFECLPDLVKLLPDDIGDLQSVSVNYGIEDCDSMGVLDAQTAKLVARLGGVPRGQPGYVLRASRSHFREFLWKHLNISTSKEFSHYTEDQDGVTAFFKDGTSARGSILIGADGSRSKVRDNLLGDSRKPVLSNYLAVTGQGELPRHVYEPLRELGTAAVLANAPNMRCLFGFRSMTPDKSSAQYYWVLGFWSQDPAAESAWLDKASKESLYDKAIELTAGWTPMLTEVIRHTGSDGMFAPPIKFYEFVSPPTLPGKRVTLLGDAAHAMTPFRGGGANTAIRDACELSKLIIQAVEDKQPLKSVLRKYEEVMLPRGSEIVLSSRAVGENLEHLMDILRKVGKMEEE